MYSNFLKLILYDTFSLGAFQCIWFGWYEVIENLWTRIGSIASFILIQNQVSQFFISFLGFIYKNRKNRKETIEDMMRDLLVVGGAADSIR